MINNQTTDVLSILKANPSIGHIADDQLEWLIAQSEIREYQEGEPLFIPGSPSEYMYIILQGRFRLWLGNEKETRELARIAEGDITGVLPYSRVKSALAHSGALEYSVALCTPRGVFPEMIRNQDELTEALVHVMNDRIRNFTSLQNQNEKLVALGKLSAGLAHELNNPAAALVRTAKELKSHVAYTPEVFKKVIRIKMDEKNIDRVNAVLFSKIDEGPNDTLSLMERTEKEDDVRDWLEDNDIDGDDEMVENLVEYGFSVDDLEEIVEATPPNEVGPIIKWINNTLTTERLVLEIRDASKRISDLVSSVKSYTHMDQTQDRQLLNIHEGIINTIVILKHKIKRNKIKLVKNLDPTLPKIYAYPGELNQVWTNLIDNAVDAMEESGGTLEIITQMDGPCVQVKVIDSGKGIPEDVLPRIFDPFFTTKPMGKGTGLGLDVVQKIILHHRADIKVASRPGRTEFSILFPVE